MLAGPTATSADARVQEDAHVAVAGLAMLPLASALMPDLLSEVERLAVAALPAAASVRVVLDDGKPDDDQAQTDRPAAGLIVPLRLHGNRLGELRITACDNSTDSFDDATRQGAELFAQAAAAVMGNARALAESRDLVRNLSQALEHRSVIEQAKGMLMAVRRCDEDAAFDHLKLSAGTPTPSCMRSPVASSQPCQSARLVIG